MLQEVQARIAGCCAAKLLHLGALGKLVPPLKEFGKQHPLQFQRMMEMLIQLMKHVLFHQLYRSYTQPSKRGMLKAAQLRYVFLFFQQVLSVEAFQQIFPQVA